MSEALSTLLNVARLYTPSKEEREEQRRSFACGNTAFENALITRRMVDEKAEKLAAESGRPVARA